jgi:uncharacterized protein (DUF3820 family)
MAKLTDDLYDDSPMPFGEHKGQPMEKVPASYFHWLWHQGCNHVAVKEYIRNNMDALMEEDPDKIWDRKKY